MSYTQHLIDQAASASASANVATPNGSTSHQALSLCFANLPSELKFKIFNMTFEDVDIIEFENRKLGYHTYFRAASLAVRRGPVALQICCESRREAQKTYRRLSGFGWFDFSKDIVYLGQGVTFEGSQLFYHSDTMKPIRDNLRLFSANFRQLFSLYPGRDLAIYNQGLHLPNLKKFYLVMCEFSLHASEPGYEEAGESACLELVETFEAPEGVERGITLAAISKIEELELARKEYFTLQNLESDQDVQAPDVTYCFLKKYRRSYR